MVTLKRDAKTESERRGGYATGLSSRMNNFDRFQLTRENDREESEITSKYYDDSPQYKEYIWNELNRTAPRRMLSPEEIKNGMKPEELQYERVAYTPTFSRASASTYRSSAVRRDEAEAQGLTSKAKLMIVAYVAVVVFFLTMIVINAGTLASLNAELTALNANPGPNVEVMDPTLTPPVVEETLAFGTGTEGNLKNAVPAGDYTSMSVSTPTTYVGSGNWFDSICDWLGNVVGG